MTGEGSDRALNQCKQNAQSCRRRGAPRSLTLPRLLLHPREGMARNGPRNERSRIISREVREPSPGRRGGVYAVQSLRRRGSFPKDSSQHMSYAGSRAAPFQNFLECPCSPKGREDRFVTSGGLPSPRKVLLK